MSARVVPKLRQNHAYLYGIGAREPVKVVLDRLVRPQLRVDPTDPEWQVELDGRDRRVKESCLRPVTPTVVKVSEFAAIKPDVGPETIGRRAVELTRPREVTPSCLVMSPPDDRRSVLPSLKGDHHPRVVLADVPTRLSVSPSTQLEAGSEQRPVSSLAPAPVMALRPEPRPASVLARPLGRIKITVADGWGSNPTA